jgi:hypothetical protein
VVHASQQYTWRARAWVKKLFLLKKFNKTLYRHTDRQRIDFKNRSGCPEYK